MAYAPDYDSTGIESYTIPNFTFTSGDTLPIRIAYRTINSPSSPKKALIPTCYGGLINQTLSLTAPSQSLHNHHVVIVVIVAMLGNGESSSPSNTPSFPISLDYRDCIRAQKPFLTHHLNWPSPDAVIGFSMAAQQAYYWTCMYPSFVTNAVVICGSARTSAHNYAFLEGPKAALLNSIDYADGNKPSRGLRLAGREKGKAEVAVIESIWGHAAGEGESAEDVEWMSGRIAEFLKGGRSDSAAWRG